MYTKKKGASKDAIEQSYKKLAYKWHPEKHNSTDHTHEALKVSQHSRNESLKEHLNYSIYFRSLNQLALLIENLSITNETIKI